MGARLQVWLRLWFSFRVPVDRRTYLAHGSALMAFKYAIDATVLWLAAGIRWTPLDYLSPMTSDRLAPFTHGDPWLGWAMVVWTLPFLWIGVSMTARRLANAGASPGWSLLFFVPVVNYGLMALLCAVPSRPAPAGERPLTVVTDARVRSALAGAGAGVALAAGIVLFSAELGVYGLSLFLATPFLLGAVAAYVHNRGHPRGTGESRVVAVATLLVAGSALLFLGLEGVVCLLMALPLALLLALMGAVFGRELAVRLPLRGSQIAAVVLVVPAMTALESAHAPAPPREVVSAVEIAAPPEAVWREVVAFHELPPPTHGLFRLGIAYPMRARIDGSGVGAVRHCEFSTGAFVEPITVWDEPRRLSFDVVRQPPPLEEWSPYRSIHPPHLDGYFRSVRGEFRLIALPGGRTRLEGSTWYELDLRPRPYWSMFADAIVRAIHARVLAHVKERAEAA